MAKMIGLLTDILDLIYTRLEASTNDYEINYLETLASRIADDRNMLVEGVYYGEDKEL